MDSSFFRMNVLVERAPLLNRSCRETVRDVPLLMFGGVFCLLLLCDVCISFSQASSLSFLKLNDPSTSMEMWNIFSFSIYCSIIITKSVLVLTWF